MGLLLAAIFVPLDVLALLAILGAGLYILLRVLRAVRYAWQMVGASSSS